MKIQELNTTSGGDNPCELVSNYLMHEERGGTMLTFLADFEYDSREEVERAARYMIRTIVLDSYMRKRHLNEINAYADAVYRRYAKIFTDANKYDKYPNSLSGELWHGGFARQRMLKRVAAFFNKKKPNINKFIAAREQIKSIYQLSDIDLDKLHFFVEQVKAGAEFPDSLRRMLYIWGAAKKTGKTTTAKMLTCLLNGDDNEEHIAHYSTTLSNEMQIKNFAVPKIAECAVCMMDECFYADMGKTYADFKRFITSSGGRARLPFGQEFEWEGQPNYIATSNDSLQKFIKDWGDRRYLSIEFRGKPTQKMDFGQIKALWRDFVINSERVKDWADWADELMEVSEERGNRTEIAEELEIELRQMSIINALTNITLDNSSPANPQNHISLKWFVDWFSASLGNAEAHKRRGEIEAAVLKVFGERYSSTNYWLLSKLKGRADELRREIEKVNTDDVPAGSIPF